MSAWFWITVIHVSLVCSLLHTARSTSAQYGDVRLAESTMVHNSAKGRLEIYLNGHWGTVCDDGFGTTEADVACRQLGFERSLYFGSTDSLWGLQAQQTSTDETLPIMLDDLWCEVIDDSLLDCSHAGIGNHNCGHNEDVQLVCLTEGSLRLVTNYAGETSFGFSRVAPTHGLLEIYMQGQWGTVCINNFDDTAANIACQSLGFTGVYHHEIAVFLGLPSGSDGTPIWLDQVTCSADDPTLLSCEHNPVGVHNCSHWQDVGVVCHESDAEWDGGALIGIVLTIIFGFGGFLSTVIGVCACLCIGLMCAKHQSMNRARRNGPTVVNTPNQGPTAPAAYPVQTYHHSTSQQGYPPPAYQQTQQGYPTQFNIIPPLPHCPQEPQGPPPCYPENQDTQSQQPAAGCPYPLQQVGFYPTQNSS